MGNQAHFGNTRGPPRPAGCEARRLEEAAAAELREVTEERDGLLAQRAEMNEAMELLAAKVFSLVKNVEQKMDHMSEQATTKLASFEDKIGQIQNQVSLVGQAVKELRSKAGGKEGEKICLLNENDLLLKQRADSLLLQRKDAADTVVALDREARAVNLLRNKLEKLNSSVDESQEEATYAKEINTASANNDEAKLERSHLVGDVGRFVLVPDDRRSTGKVVPEERETQVLNTAGSSSKSATELEFISQAGAAPLQYSDHVYTAAQPTTETPVGTPPPFKKGRWTSYVTEVPAIRSPLPPVDKVLVAPFEIADTFAGDECREGAHNLHSSPSLNQEAKLNALFQVGLMNSGNTYAIDKKKKPASPRLE